MKNSTKICILFLAVAAMTAGAQEIEDPELVIAYTGDIQSHLEECG